jgi:hypothetical protein
MPDSSSIASHIYSPNRLVVVYNTDMADSDNKSPDDSQEPNSTEAASAAGAASASGVVDPVDTAASETATDTASAAAVATDATPASTSADSLTSAAPSAAQGSKRLSRSRNILLVSVLLVATFALGLVWFCYQYLLPVIYQPAAALTPATEINTADSHEQGTIPLTVQYEHSAIPDLSKLFGKTSDEALATLGQGWSITKDADTTQEPPAEGAEPIDSAIKRIVTLSYTPTILSVEGGSFEEGDAGYSEVQGRLPIATIYLSMNAEGKVIEVYFVADIDLFETVYLDFDTLLSTGWFLSSALQDSGVAPRDYNYRPPDFSQTASYDYPESPNRRVIKQSAIFSGRVDAEGLPSAWAVTVTYEFMTPVDNPSLVKASRRVIHIRLS